MLECVINLAEGRETRAVEAIVQAAAPALLDVHVDADHNRSVFTLAGPMVEDAAWSIAEAAAHLLDIRHHVGVHPWLGAIDVVPFVPLGTASLDAAIEARNRMGARLASELSVPVFFYGPERGLPEVRRRAFRDLAPDLRPTRPNPRLGASCVGARGPLVAYNVVVDASLEVAREVARELRGPAVRALAFQAGRRVQVSMNLIDPRVVGPAQVVDRIASRVSVRVCELVGLVPRWVLDDIPAERWAELDLGPDRTIEVRLLARGLPLPA
ncbi:Formiminotransferase domain protein [Acidimicrobium ferrooxidans DSM 10331]|uniref:glutamate formimidoyltransferase n=1 Tax=Acidimicrobium ferrooxidans (strain DSM 10331 / JCM 15462 / NBRC 103882 / ICP) TaxID=525909 RepID=C7M2Q3_ACIFD|nr:Formiminotransferase domain-containing protein [Acidimicrobium ferrooxidans]ACU53297.1 Formiminotransferase domain protein [Acidimicrobium ferrooxidans DSM 10331]